LLGVFYAAKRQCLLRHEKILCKTHTKK